MRNHRKIKALRNKFGSIQGYAFWVMILEYLTELDGNEMEFSETECEMFAAELGGVSAAETRQMIDFCIKLELLFERNGFIHSHSLDEKLLPVYEKRGREKQKSATRKRRQDGSFHKNSTNEGISDDDNSTGDGVSVAETPHSKEKEKKEKKKEKKKTPANSETELAVFEKSEFSSNGSDTEKKLEKTGNALPGLNGSEINAKSKPESLFTKFMKIYFDWMKEKAGVVPMIDGGEGKALKSIVAYFEKISNDEAEIITGWKALFHNYDRWDRFHQRQLKLRQINSNLINIINSIKNGKQSITTGKSIEQQRDEIINSPEWRDS